MKKRVCSLMLMFCMMVGMMLSVGAAGTPSDWAAAEVKTAIAEGLTTDKVTKDYQKNITREEFCELVVILYQKLTSKTATANEDPFTDTDNTEILKAYALGIVNGVSQTEFAPNNTITRQEMCVMIVRAIEAILGDEFILKYDFVNFADNREIANWAFEQIYYAYEKGIVKGVGDNKFAPLGTATCEQAVIMLFRLYENIDNCKDEIPEKVKQNYEYYSEVNRAFGEIEKTYLNEKGYVDPEKIPALLEEIYLKAQEFQKEGIMDSVQYNEKYHNVCCVLGGEMKYLYQPPVEGLASRGKEIDVLSFDNLSTSESVWPNLLETLGANLNVFDGLEGMINFGTYGNIIDSSVGCNSVRYINQYDKGYSIHDYIYFLSTLNPDKKQVILWRGHGGLYTKDKESCCVFWVNADVNDDLKNFYSWYKYNDLLAWGEGASALALTPKFFETYLAEVKGGMFYSGACHSSGDGGDMGMTILEKGFDCYLGSSDEIVNIYSDVMMHAVVQNLCQYEDDVQTIPISKALLMAREKYGESDYDYDVETKIADAITKEYTEGAKVLLATLNEDYDFRLLECPTVKSSNIAEYDGVLYTTNRGVPGMEYIPVEPANYQYICGIAFYGNKLYYACKEHGTSDYRSAIYSCNIDGSNHKLIYDSTYDATDFIISNNKLYPGNKRGYFDLTTNAYVDLAHLLPEGCIIKYAYGNNVYYGTYIKSKKTYSVYKLNVVTGESECIKTGISDIYKYREVIPNDGNAYYKEGTYLYRVNKKGAQRVVDLGHGTARLIAVIGDVVYYDYTEGNTVCFSYYNLETNETATIASHVAAGSGRYFGW